MSRGVKRTNIQNAGYQFAGPNDGERGHILVSSLAPSARSSSSVSWVVADFAHSMDSESLTYLLRGGHYNVPDRVARGIWPHPPLRFDALVKHLAQVIQKEKWFPYEPKVHKSGEPVVEMGFIERVAPDRFVYHAQRGYAHDPCTIAESSKTPFSSAQDVARHYLKWSLYLPGDLDSWQVI